VGQDFGGKVFPVSFGRGTVLAIPSGKLLAFNINLNTVKLQN
jgi:hypothetical protein